MEDVETSDVGVEEMKVYRPKQSPARYITDEQRLPGCQLSSCEGLRQHH